MAPQTSEALEQTVVLLTQWAQQQLQRRLSCQPLAGDAGVRRYYRAQSDSDTWILVFSPPEDAPLAPFIQIDEIFSGAGVTVPDIIATDAKQGFMILSDFGDTLLSMKMTDTTLPHYMSMALDTLLLIHSCRLSNPPTFGKTQIQAECMLFQQWFLEKHLNLKLSSTQKRLLKQTCHRLVLSAEAQPQVLLHRDYHAENLMCLSNDTLGVIDFQSAAIGPITYDAVSLLRDARLSWPTTAVYEWALYFKKRCEDQYLMAPVSIEQYIHWFDWTGIQLHLKILGIFARLHHRDNKSNYLKHIPRLLNYLITVTQNYSMLEDFLIFLKEIQVAWERGTQHASHDFGRR